MPTAVRRILFALFIVAAQWLVFGRLRLWGTYPDIVLLYVAWIGIQQGRRVGSVVGFGCGLLMDLIYDTWGLHMLVKTLVGFLVGLFPASERESLLILPRQAFIGGLVIALLQNGILVTLLALQTGSRDAFLVTGLWLGASLYTALMGVLGSVVLGR